MHHGCCLCGQLCMRCSQRCSCCTSSTRQQVVTLWLQTGAHACWIVYMSCTIATLRLTVWVCWNL